MHVRDRIRELRRVPARLLRPHPRNWRTHPQAQQDALRGVLAEIGYAGALVARELPDGALELIDGHLRAETTPEMEVPVLVVDLTEAEARLLLAVHDPLAALAERDEQALAGLLAEVDTQNAAVAALLDEMTAAARDPAAPADDAEPPEVDIPRLFQVVVECRDEAEQRSVFERLSAEGLACRLLHL